MTVGLPVLLRASRCGGLAKNATRRCCYYYAGTSLSLHPPSSRSTTSAPWQHYATVSAGAPPTTTTTNATTTNSTPSKIPAKRHHHRIVIIGGGTAGVTIAAQLRRRAAYGGEDATAVHDVALLDPAPVHHYQPGWTLVGTGLAELGSATTRRPLAELVPDGVTHYGVSVTGVEAERNVVRTREGVEVQYDYLVVAPGLESNWGGVKGLTEALEDPGSGVASIYDEKYVQQVWRNIQAFKKGKAVFTQPAGAIKCAGAPQKVMWMALSQWKRDGVRENVEATFATGAPTMFAVPKYSQALDELRKERNVEGLFQHNLVGINAKDKVATFKNLADGGKEVQREYGFLHVVPPQKPWDWVAKSPLADSAGWVDVNKATAQHTKFPNVFSLGDASSLPNSKTAAAITAQAPVLVRNLLTAMRPGTSKDDLKAIYDGYASCPLLTGHNELMLCEFKYGGVPKETFANIIGGQEVPRRAFYHLKKDFFPWVYWNHFIKGTWQGPKGFSFLRD